MEIDSTFGEGAAYIAEFGMPDPAYVDAEFVAYGLEGEFVGDEFVPYVDSISGLPFVAYGDGVSLEDIMLGVDVQSELERALLRDADAYDAMYGGPSADFVYVGDEDDYDC